MSLPRRKKVTRVEQRPVSKNADLPALAPTAPVSSSHITGNPSAKVTLLLVRHAETTYSSQNRIQGQLDVPLSDFGREQAEALRRRLEEMPIDVCYSSDLRRAVESAELILKGRDVPFITTPNLRERHYGEWQGLTRAEVESRYPHLYTELRAGSILVRPPSGECDQEVLVRVASFLNEILPLGSDKSILIVAHSVPLRVAICCLLGASLAMASCLRISNASLTIVEHDGKRGLLRLLNDTCFQKVTCAT